MKFNSIRNKFDKLQNIFKRNVDILVIAETNIDQSFTTAQFVIESFHKPFRLNVSDRSGGLLVYVTSYITSSQHIKSKTRSNI